MKIVYISNFDGNINSGINKKIKGQVAALKEYYPETKLIYIVNKGTNLELLDGIDSISAHVTPFRNISEKIKNLFFLSNDLKELLNYDMDILYLRSPIIPSSLMKKLKKKGVQIVIELVSNTKQEALIRGSYINANIINYLYKKRIKISNKVVSVTQEIFEINYGIKDKLTLELGNGYSVDAATHTNTNTYKEGDVLNLVCVANFNKWHAIDRILEGLRNFEYKDKINIYLVGDGRELENLKEITKKYNLDKQVFFLGFLTGDHLNKVLSKTHIGIANLGIHRKKLQYTSSLKSREYCSKAIPFIYAGIDNDFNNFKYALQFEANDEPIDLNEILLFANNTFRDKDMRKKMRSYALENLSYSVKAKKLIDFLK